MFSLIYYTQINASPLPTKWPAAFAVKFVSNVSSLEQSGNKYAIKGAMYYDSSLGVQRIDHDRGSASCQVYNSSSACSLYFTKEGIYRALHESLPTGETQGCCLDTDNRAGQFLPSNWTQNAKSVFEGYKTLMGEDSDYLKVGSWNIFNEDIAGYIGYQEVAPGHKLQGQLYTLNLKLYSGRYERLHFTPSSMNIGPQDPGTFLIPEECYQSCRRRSQQKLYLRTK